MKRGKGSRNPDDRQQELQREREEAARLERLERGMLEEEFSQSGTDDEAEPVEGDDASSDEELPASDKGPAEANLTASDAFTAATGNSRHTSLSRPSKSTRSNHSGNSSRRR